MTFNVAQPLVGLLNDDLQATLPITKPELPTLPGVTVTASIAWL